MVTDLRRFFARAKEEVYEMLERGMGSGGNYIIVRLIGPEPSRSSFCVRPLSRPLLTCALTARLKRRATRCTTCRAVKSSALLELVHRLPHIKKTKQITASRVALG